MSKQKKEKMLNALLDAQENLTKVGSFSKINESDVESPYFRNPPCVIIHSGQVINVDDTINNLSGYNPDTSITLAEFHDEGLNLSIRIPRVYLDKKLPKVEIKDLLSTELRKFHTLLTSCLLPPEHIIDNEFVAFSVSTKFNVLNHRLVSAYVLAFSNLDANLR